MHVPCFGCALFMPDKPGGCDGVCTLPREPASFATNADSTWPAVFEDDSCEEGVWGSVGNGELAVKR